MKTTKLLFLSLAVIFFSCSEDDEPLPTSQGMVGTWTMTAVDYRGTSTTTVMGVTAKADFTGTGKDISVMSTFNENPNTVATEGSYIIVLTTTSMGQTHTDEVAFEDVITDGTWTLDGRTLTITGPIGPQKATIVEQTSTALKMSMDVKQNQTTQTGSITADIKITFTFKK